jgi:predicted CXXCH cytochrome family protein
LRWNPPCLFVGLAVLAGIAVDPGVTARAETRSTNWDLRAGPGVSNHPVNVVPPSSMRIPEGWPLSASGAITCLTCHETLGVGSAIGSERGSQLREFQAYADDGVDFCANCHAGGDDRTARGMHWLALRKAHIGPSDTDDRTAGTLDAESRRCMECHDGVTAGEFANTTPWDRGGGYVGEPSRNHPVGVAYPRTGRRADRTSNSEYRLAAALPKQVRLPDGKVSCVSCHDLYTSEPKLLSVPIRESALCMTCHTMD